MAAKKYMRYGRVSTLSEGIQGQLKLTVCLRCEHHIDVI